MSGTITTRIATSDAHSITLRGYDLVEELIGRYSYTEILYFLITNRLPAVGETRILDACLVTLMEHGFTPSSIVARMVADNVPGQAQVAMAAGLLTIGDVFVGTMEGCARLLDEGMRNHPADLHNYCRRTTQRHKAAGQRIPGFGHPFHKPEDPRPPRLFKVAEEAGAKGDYIALLKMLSATVDEAYGRHLTINATGAIGALLLEIGIPATIIRGIAVVSRAGGLTGHLLEEKQAPAAREIWRLAETNIRFESPRGGVRS